MHQRMVHRTRRQIGNPTRMTHQATADVIAFAQLQLPRTSRHTAPIRVRVAGLRTRVKMVSTMSQAWHSPLPRVTVEVERAVRHIAGPQRDHVLARDGRPRAGHCNDHTSCRTRCFNSTIWCTHLVQLLAVSGTRPMQSARVNGFRTRPSIAKPSPRLRRQVLRFRARLT